MELKEFNMSINRKAEERNENFINEIESAKLFICDLHIVWDLKNSIDGIS